MKQLWRKWGLPKSDELERHILLRAQRNAYFFLMLALVFWCFYESYRVYSTHGRLNPAPCLLLAGATLTQALSQALLTRSAVKDDEDSCETGPLLRLIMLVCAAVGVAAAGVAAVVLMGVWA